MPPEGGNVPNNLYEKYICRCIVSNNPPQKKWIKKAFRLTIES